MNDAQPNSVVTRLTAEIDTAEQLAQHCRGVQPSSDGLHEWMITTAAVAIAKLRQQLRAFATFNPALAAPLKARLDAITHDVLTPEAARLGVSLDEIAT